MKDKKHLVQLILAIITFTVLLIFVVNHLHIISGFFGMVFYVLLPFLIGCGISFVLNIPMRGIEQGIFKNEKNRLYRFRRPISMVLTYIAALLFIALVLFVVVPEVADTVGKVKELLKKAGMQAMMIENCGMENEKIYQTVDEIPENAGYYSLIIVKEN